MSRPRVAIVGLGMAVTPHAKSYLDLKDRVELAYAYSPSAARRRAFAEIFPFPLADSLEQILGDDSVVAVSLLTPPNTHLELVERCASAGKHILLEKPLEVSLARSRRLVAACRKAGVTLGVVLQHRFRPPAVKLREIMSGDGLGRLIAASTSILNWRPQSYYDQPGRGTKARDGGGVLLTQGIHTLDLFLSLTGLPKKVFAYATTSPVHRMETEDLVTAALSFANGALGSITATTAAYPGFPEEITLVSEGASAHIAGDDLTLQYKDGKTEKTTGAKGAGGAGADPMAFPNDYHRDLISDFLDAIEGARDPLIGGEEALKVHRLIEAMLDSAERGRPVAL